MYHARPWTDNAEELSAGSGFLTWGRSWHPFVLPGRYTHLEVSKSGKNGVARWQLDRLSPEDVPPLPADIAGQGRQLFVWEGGPLELRYECSERSGALGVTLHAFGSGEPLDVETTGSLRGTVRLSGPGYVGVHPWAGAGWSLKSGRADA